MADNFVDKTDTETTSCRPFEMVHFRHNTAVWRQKAVCVYFAGLLSFGFTEQNISD